MSSDTPDPMSAPVANTSQTMTPLEDLLLRLHDMHSKMGVNNEHRSLVALAVQVIFQQADLIGRLSTQLRQQQPVEPPRVSLS